MTKDEALKMAIDYLDGFKSEDKETTLELTRIISTLKCTLVQPPPEVEPFDVWAGTNPQEDVPVFCPRWDNGEPFEVRFPKSPAPSWQGLSDDEIDVIANSHLEYDMDLSNMDDFARAIEAKLKEKNHG